MFNYPLKTPESVANEDTTSKGLIFGPYFSIYPGYCACPVGFKASSPALKKIRLKIFFSKYFFFELASLSNRHNPQTHFITLKPIFLSLIPPLPFNYFPSNAVHTP